MLLFLICTPKIYITQRLIYTFLKIIILLGAGTVSLLASPNNSSSLIHRLDQHIKDYLHQQKIVGCSVAIVDHGHLIFIKSYGHLKKDKKEKINNNTLFQLGSISKTITATLVAKLIKEKSLSLHLTSQAFAPYLTPPITLQQILSHTTGYRRTLWNQKIETGTSRTLLLETLSEQTPLSPVYDYHNMVFSLVEEAISSELHEGFASIVDKKLLAPLHMRQTTIGWKKPDPFSFAWPHQKNNKGQLYASKEYSTYYHQTVPSAGGMNSSINDMVRFLQLQLGYMPDYLTSGELSEFHAPQVAAPDALAWLPFKKNLTSYYGLGWRSVDYKKERIVFHGGCLKGFHNFLGFIPNRKIGIIILNNSDSNLALTLAFRFFDELLST